MKKSVIFCIVFFVALSAFAQEQGISIFQLVKDGGQVTIQQSQKIENEMSWNVWNNSYKMNKGFRVRIYFDNNQLSRHQSQEVFDDFKILYPDVPAYRVFEELYYKVTVGDFRTKSEAMRFKENISTKYPSAFVTTEQVNLLKILQPQPPADTTNVEILIDIFKTQ